MAIRLLEEINEDNEWDFVEEFATAREVLNRTLLRETLLAEAEELLKLGEKLFGMVDSDKNRARFKKFLDGMLGGQKKGGAPLNVRALVVLMKLIRGIPKEVVLKEEIEIEISRQLERPVGGRKRDYEFTAKSRPGAAFEAARKRVYRERKHCRELGLPTHSLTLEQWESLERFAQLLKKAESSSETSVRGQGGALWLK